MNHKNERIKKLISKGITDIEQLSKKTGLSVERIKIGIEWLKERGEIEWQSR